MTSNPPENSPLSYEQLQEQNHALRLEIEALRVQEPLIWRLFAETSRKLQIYSASIKAAVSSLLSYEIFWDSANQHEFLETIDSSVNQVSEMTVLLTLAFRAQANTLTLRKDPQLLQEILSVAQMAAVKKTPEMRMEVTYPPHGKLVLVDYEYLTKTLLLLFEVLYSRDPSKPVRIGVSETEDGWFLDFWGLDAPFIDTIMEMRYCKTQSAASELLSTENILKLHIVCEILHLQDISVDTIDGPDESLILRLSVPGIAPK